MNVLPIVTRELTVAARRKSTYRIRLWSAFAAILVASALLIFFEMDARIVSGKNVFMILNSYAFGLCLFAGSFLTADCLSEEKREGTLGLLFLTDLKGYDVVLGKMLATSLNAFYALFALFPVLALPLLLGGVTGGEFWRTMLGLLNALFFSLSLGMWISARSRDSDRVLGLTFSGLLFFAGVLPLLEQLRRSIGLPSQWWFALSPSPFFPFYLAGESHYLGAPQNFFISIFASQLVAWAFIFRASVALPRSWQDKEERVAQPGQGGWRALGRWFPSFVVPSWKASPRKLLEENPVLWLVSGKHKLYLVIWILTAIGLTICAVATFFAGGKSSFIPFISTSALAPIAFIIKMIVAVRAPAFFVESRKSGALELLLSTPLTSREIIRGQWLALEKLFLWPMILLAIAMVVPAFFLSQVSDAFIALALYAAFKFCLSLFAIGWFGMWMGLSLKKPNYAAGLTVLFCVLLPMMAFCVPDVAIYLFLLFWSKGKVERDLRKTAINV